MEILSSSSVVDQVRATCGQLNYFHALDPPWLSTIFQHQFQDRGDGDFRWRYSP